MNVVHAEVRNFGSYKHLEFNFQNHGLTLLAGPTGAGKSTLCDVIPWALFGVTAKNGLADDVRAWNATEPTVAKITVMVGTQDIQVTRIRDPKANDLYFQKSNGFERIRGKDLADTQRLLNEVLGLDSKLYLAGAYFHEFSQTASFFTAPAKVRRMLTEQLVDLSLPKRLAESAAAQKKELKKKGTELQDLHKEIRIHLKNSETQLAKEQERGAHWVKEQELRIAKAELAKDNFLSAKRRQVKNLEKQSEDFVAQQLTSIARYEAELEDLEKQLETDASFTKARKSLDAKIAALGEDVCNECGAKKHNTKRIALTKEGHDLNLRMSEQNNVKRAIANVQKFIKLEKAKVNPYPELIAVAQNAPDSTVDQLATLIKETSSFIKTIHNTQNACKAHATDLEEVSELLVTQLQELSDVELLIDVLDTFRGTLVKKAILELESKTNDLLDRHFDAELRVRFEVSDADSLDVTITKDGNECSYPQLSKGQRQLLKLCFGVSVMKSVATQNAVKFEAIFLDEFADGCDEDIKRKAYALLQELALEYTSVFAIDHSEGLKSLFSNRYDIKLVEGGSLIEKAD